LSKSDISRWFSVPSWKRTPAPAPAAEPHQAIIIFHTGSPFELELIKHLEKQLFKPLVYEYASFYNNNVPTALNPQSMDELTTIFNDPKNRFGKKPLTVLHLALLPSQASMPHQLRLQHLKKMVLTASINLAQALDQCDRIEKAKILFIGSELCQIDENDLLTPEKQLVSGPAVVIPQEYPNLECRIIDLKIDQAGKLSEKSLELLTLELKGDSQCQRVALRNWRWEEDFSNLNLDLKRSANGLTNRLRDNGVYLLIGGLGGIGITLAGVIAENSRDPKLVLLSRTPLPKRDQWQKITQNSSGAFQVGDRQLEKLRQSEIINTISRWEQTGAEVILMTADAADGEQLKSVVDELKEQFGKIDGVIQAAGVGGGRLLLQTDTQELDRVLRPKVDASLNLARFIDLEELDFAKCPVRRRGEGAGVDDFVHWIGADGFFHCSGRPDCHSHIFPGVPGDADNLAPASVAHCQRIQKGVGSSICELSDAA